MATTYFEKGLEKGMEKGMEKGIEKGMEKGMEKGIEKGMEKGGQMLLIAQLEACFGELPAELRHLVATLSFERVKELTIKSLHANSLDELKLSDDA